MRNARQLPVRPRLLDDRGFTLVELLVTLVLLGLMTVFLFDGFRLGTREWETGAERMEEVNRVQAVQNLLRREMNRAVLSRLSGSAEDIVDTSVFIGEADRVQFLAPLPIHQGVGGLYLFSLELERRGGSGDLMLIWCLYRPDWAIERCEEPDGSAMLLENVQRLNLAYLATGTSSGSTAWSSAWSTQDRLPFLVRIDVEFESGDRRFWPSLIVAPMARQL